MRNLIFATLLGALLFPTTARAAPGLSGIKIAITNPSDRQRHAEPVVIPIAELRRIAPDLHAGSLIVTEPRTGDLQQDAGALQAAEIQSQIDALDDDGKADELAFQLDLRPHETCMVTVTYGKPNRILKIRGDYPAGTDALFAKRIQGLGWESDKNAWRIYFDPRNAVDLYAKKPSTPLLTRFATPQSHSHTQPPPPRNTHTI